MNRIIDPNQNNQQQAIDFSNTIFGQCIEAARELIEKKQADVLGFFMATAYYASFTAVDPEMPPEQKAINLYNSGMGFMRSLLRWRNLPFVENMTDQQVLAKVQEEFNAEPNLELRKV